MSRTGVSILAVALALSLGGCAAPTAIEREPAAEARLATQVKIALVEAADIDAAAIFVEADGDRVRLGGFTDSAAERARAAEIARNVPGVAGVESQSRLR
jgi:osmotically-inducible protein OsmY